jgi:uncharacterized membrane protein YedE/YeeE
MQEVDVAALATQVLWAAFALSFAFGAIAQRTQFCTMGAVADVVTMGDWSRMRMWVLAIGTAMLGFNAMVALGWVEAGDSLYAGPRLTWLSAAVGGLMFGFGMVLASGCGSRTLVRLGAGNLKSLVVFFVLGLAAFATLKGVTPRFSGRLRVKKGATSTCCSEASASARWWPASGGCRASSATWRRTRTPCRRRSSRPIRGAWSR